MCFPSQLDTTPPLPSEVSTGGPPCGLPSPDTSCHSAPVSNLLTSRLHPRALSLALLLALAGQGCTDDSDAEGATNESGTSEATNTDSDTTTDTAEESSTTGVPADCTPELEALRADIFVPSCALAGCHNSADAAAGLDLEAADLEAELVGIPGSTCEGTIRVVPGAPADSLLYLKIANQAPCGAAMPPPGGLPSEEFECVGAWIEQLEGLDCETCGGDTCVDLESDPLHCGACDEACPGGLPCEAGACVCPDEAELCGESCVELDSDPDNCGSCGMACAPGCGELTNCEGACVDPETDPNNCGMCGNTCPNGNACEAGSCGCPGDGIAFAAEVEPILVDNCTNMGCHGFPMPAAGLDLRVGAGHGELVGVPSQQCQDRELVAPGQPGASYLMDKVDNGDICSGTAMPKGGGSLTDAEVAALNEWICRGAADD